MTTRDLERGAIAARELTASEDQLSVFALDVCDDQQPAALADFVASHWGRLDILINNAGVALDQFVRFVDLDVATLRQTLETNVIGAFKVTQALIPALKASGDARIVNVSSQLGSLNTMTGYTLAYRMSKTALNTMTRIWATEFKESNILVNSVCPGWVRTELGGDQAPVSPEEGARAILKLACISSDGPTGTFWRDGAEHPW
jgi:NAD(P)-dependent dehydrogenase (short-subunit alcohol dehydrogenase family)